MNSTTADHIRQLLTKILDKKYPHLDKITETELLGWVMWPSFLGMIGNIEITEDQHHIAIATALSMLENLSDSICKKSITLNLLDYVKDNDRQLEKLCIAVNSCKRQICNCPQYFELDEQIKDCFRIKTLYLYYRNQIHTLLQFCRTISGGTYV